MAATFDTRTAARLLKLRVLLAGEGAFRLQHSPDSGSFGALCILPGQGSTVELWSGFGAAQLAGMTYADGQPLARRLDIAVPGTFASLMHNADCMSWVPDRRGTGATSSSPSDIRILANRIVSSDDPHVAAALEEAWDMGRTVDMPVPDLDAGTGAWTPAPGGSRLLERCLVAEDPCVVEAAETLVMVARGLASATVLDDLESMAGTNEWVDEWTCRADVERTPSIPVEDLEWVRLDTPAAVTAEARRMGRLEGGFLGDPMSRSVEPRSLDEILGTLSPDGSAPWMKNHHIAGDREIWTLRDERGRSVGIASVEHGQVVMAGPDGRDGDVLIRHFDAIMALRQARCPEPPGMAP